MRRNRLSVVVLLLAVACFADRAVVAAPALPPQAASFAQRVVTRLTVRFCRTVVALRLVTRQTDASVQVRSEPVPAAPVLCGLALPFSQLALPPPAC